jgi:uncharacterized protein (TIGR02996 family)
VNRDDLLDAIVESPTDDGPRLVYADWLQQQTDGIDRARGEYISLACSKANKPERAKKRMEELLTRHEAAWLGPVKDLVDPQGSTWARGFLEHCILELRGKDVQPALGHPAWRTLRCITSQGHEYRDDRQRRVHASLRAILTQPALASLRGLYVHESMFPDLGTWEDAPRVTELAIAPSGDDPAKLIPGFAADCFSRLQRLHLFGCDPVLACKLRPGVTLSVVDNPDVLSRWLATLTARNASFEEVRIVSGVYVNFTRYGHELVVRRSPAKQWSALEIRWGQLNEVRFRSRTLYELARLPEGAITHLSFVGPVLKRFDVARFKQRVIATLAARQPDLQVG